MLAGAVPNALALAGLNGYRQMARLGVETVERVPCDELSRHGWRPRVVDPIAHLESVSPVDFIHERVGIKNQLSEKRRNH
jgi:hypothetical protein